MSWFTRACVVSFFLVTACPGGRRASMSPRGKKIDDLTRRIHVVVLGTGTPNADPMRHGPALAVNAGSTPYLVDCGPGVVRRAAAAHRMGISALRVSRLRRVFLTHLHSDHTVGFPDLILTPWVLGRNSPLLVFGPEGTVEMTTAVLQAFRRDIRIRLEGLEPANERGWKVRATDARPGKVYRDSNVEVTAFPARHGAWKQVFGYRFRTKEADICVSGDTRPYPGMEASYRGCDLLIHEVYSGKALARRPKKWQAYHRASHTSAAELARVAARVRPRLLVLTHQLRWGTKDRDLVREVKAGYNGRVVSGSDLMLIGVTRGFAPKKSGNPRGRFVVIDLVKSR